MEIGLPKELNFNRQEGRIVLFGMGRVFPDEFLLNILLSEFEREGT